MKAFVEYDQGFDRAPVEQKVGGSKMDMTITRMLDSQGLISQHLDGEGSPSSSKMLEGNKVAGGGIPDGEVTRFEKPVGSPVYFQDAPPPFASRTQRTCQKQSIGTDQSSTGSTIFRADDFVQFQQHQNRRERAISRMRDSFNVDRQGSFNGKLFSSLETLPCGSVAGIAARKELVISEKENHPSRIFPFKQIIRRLRTSLRLTR